MRMMGCSAAAPQLCLTAGPREGPLNRPIPGGQDARPGEIRVRAQPAPLATDREEQGKQTQAFWVCGTPMSGEQAGVEDSPGGLGVPTGLLF